MFISKTPCHILATLHMDCPLVCIVFLTRYQFTQHDYEYENRKTDDTLVHYQPTNSLFVQRTRKGSQ